MNALTLSISNTLIRQDDQGRYCLNDLHKAAGNNSKHQPANFLRLDSTKELAEEINRSSDMMNAIEAKQGGKQQGTYAAKELVYAYAMWISPKFHLQVIRTFDALVTQTYVPPTGPLTLAQFNAAQHTLTAAQKHLNNTQVIVSAADLLGLKGKKRKTKAIAPRKWTPDEDEVANQMNAEGHGPTAIAKQLGDRTAHAVYNHLRYLAQKQGGAA